MDATLIFLLVGLAVSYVAMFFVGKKFGAVIEQDAVARVLAEYKVFPATREMLISSLKADYAKAYDAAVAELDKVKKAL